MNAYHTQEQKNIGLIYFTLVFLASVSHNYTLVALSHEIIRNLKTTQLLPDSMSEMTSRQKCDDKTKCNDNDDWRLTMETVSGYSQPLLHHQTKVAGYRIPIKTFASSLYCSTTYNLRR